MPEGWTWDETLFLGSAPHYLRGRLPYAPDLAERLADLLGWDGRGRLLDVGCGPGVLALPLAPYFDDVVGLDPDAGMLTEAARRAGEAGVRNARWVRARAEELPADLGTFRAAAFAQSFHWMERERVAAAVFGMLEPGGAFVHVSGHNGDPLPADDPALPLPPYGAIGALVRAYLGEARRAGRGVFRESPSGEAEVLRGAGFGEPLRLRLPAGAEVVRTADDLVAWVWSRSGSAPHLFGDRRGAFEADLRRVLGEESSGGRFGERVPDTEVMVWRKPGLPPSAS